MSGAENSDVRLIPAFEKREELIPLYEEYANMLVKTDPVFTKSRKCGIIPMATE